MSTQTVKHPELPSTTPATSCCEIKLENISQLQTGFDLERSCDTRSEQKNKAYAMGNSVKRALIVKAELGQKTRQKLANDMGGNLIPVAIELFEPYVKFVLGLFALHRLSLVQELS